MDHLKMDDNSEWLNFDEDDNANDSSFPATFASYFSSEISNDLRNNFNEIGNIWLDMGIPVSKRDEQVSLLRNGIMDFVKNFQEKERACLKKQQNYREFQLIEINKILKALSMDAYVIDSSRTLLVQNKLLLQKFKELEYVKNERMEQLERITSKLKKICHLLGSTYEEPIFATNIPSESELMTLRSQQMNQEQQLETRKKRYESLKSLIIKFQVELDYSPKDSQERMFLSSGSEVIYSQQTLSQIGDFHKRIVQLYNQAKTEIGQLNSTIEKLFARLDIAENDQKAFWQSLTGSLPRIKQLLTIEIDKYEKLKKSCMEKIIKNIRKDLDILCKQCMVATFNDSILVSQDFSEELLVLHENELAKLSNFNTHYSNVLKKMAEWEESLEKLLELEKKLLDPNRFNNRGGALLLNERERRTLSKKLPRIENEIKSLVTMIESKENIPFNSYGQQIDEFFESNWNHFQKSKDGAKKPTDDNSKKSGSASTVGSSQKKYRYPLSPRVNNKKLPNNMASRQLFTPRSGDLGVDEAEFQKHLLQQNELQSTFCTGSVEKVTSHSKLVRTPMASKLSKMNTRRMSKSCDDLTKLTSKGKTTALGFTRGVTKRPPFLP